MEAPSIKMIFVGDTLTGKTSIITWYISGVPNTSTKATIGAAFLTRELSVNNRFYELVLWDTAGQETYRGLGPIYYRGSQIAFVVFDVTSETTFNSLEQWIQEVRNEVDSNTIIGIVGNKIDKEGRVISSDKARQFAKEQNAKYYETCAITGEGIESMIEDAVKEVIPQIVFDENDAGEVVNIQSQTYEIKKNTCC